MKKRLLSALLALALVFVLLPTTALAGETTYSDSEITISGKYWNFGNKGTSGEYAPVYFRSNGTAFEESEPTGSNYLEIRKTSANEITIKVHGTVDLTEDENSKNSCISVNSMHMNKRNLIITGAAKGSTLNLTCKNYSHPLYSYEGSITINGGVTVNATSQYSNNNNNVSVYGIQVSNGHNLTISGANTKVNVANKTYDSTVKVDGNITVSGGAQLKAENKSGKVTGYTSKKAYAIECVGQLSISGENTKVTAKTSNGEKAISGTVYNLTENDDYKLTFKAGMYEGAPSFDYPKPMDKALGYEYVEITQAPTDPYVFIAGEPAIMGQETPIPGGSGTYLYVDAGYDGNILTLKDATINKTDSIKAVQAIRFGQNGYYTIKLEGKNTISDFSTGIVAPNDPGVNGVTVVLSGSGSLDISANQYAIDMQVGNLKFENTGKIMLTTGHNYVKPLNALHVAGNVTIDKTKYDITGEKPVVKPTTEDIGSSPVLETILKGTSTDETLYFKSITITPAAAKDSTIRYNGTTLKQGETIRNGGTATVDSKNNTITLKNFKGTKALSFDATLADSTLVLEGTNTLSSIVTTQKGLTISGSGSLTVGSIRVTNNDNISADLIITGGAHVTVNRPSEDKPAVEVSGNLTVTGDGTQLSAECTAATNPAIEVGGNVTISGNPGTNAYTVKAYNKYATQRGRDDNLRPSQMPSAFEISGNLSISGSAQVMAQTDSDGAAVWMPKEKVISVADASLIAQNRSHNFSTISFGDESNMGNIYAKGQVNIVAENMLHSDSSLAHRAIKAFIYNHYSTGDSNPYYINVVSEGVRSGGNVNVIPGHCTSTGGYKVTITRGDAYTTPQVAANYTIAGQTMYVGKYYKTDVDGNITDGTAQDYNIYCDSENDFTLNNATISSIGTSGRTGVIMTDPNASSNEIHIKLIGTNSINNAGHHAILGKGSDSTIIIENAENASNASLTISGNFLPVYSFGNVTINAEVVIINTNGNGYLISTNKGGHANGAFDLGSGYKCYASTSTTGTPLEEFNSANYSTYKYLRVTTQTLETGGGSTHQHTWDTTKWYDVGEGCHARKCTGCDEYDLTNKQAHYAWPDENKGSEGHTEKCMLCDYKYDQSVIKPHEWTGWWVNDYQPEVHTQRCNCGYLGSTHRTLKYVAINGEQHQKRCPVDGCDYKIESSTTAHVYAEGSNICTECGYDKSAPCDHTGDRVYTNNGDGTHKVTCKACGATIVEKQSHEFNPTGVCIYCGATQSGGDPTPDNPGTIVIIRPAEEEKPAQQPNPSTGANDLVGLAVAAAVAAALGSAALLRKHD